MTTRWAVLGAARIAADRFIPAVRAAGGTVSVLACRDLDRGRRFARENAIAHVVDDYAAGVMHPQVDGVYIALPNSMHRTWVERAVRAGRPVLCEKPIAFDVQDAEAIVSLSEETGVPVWESFAFLHQAQTRRVRQLVCDGTIGDLRTITARFHFDLLDPDDIRWRRDLGGGALLDVGCYMCKWGRELCGRPVDVHAWATHRDGVDAQFSGVLNYRGGISMFVSCGFTGEEDTSMLLHGTKGSLAITQPWHPGPGDTLTLRRGGEELVERHGTQYSFAPMLQHIHLALAGGRTSPFALGAALIDEAKLLQTLLEKVRPHEPS